MEERRLLLAVAVSFLALTAIRVLYPTKAPETRPEPTQVARSAAEPQPQASGAAHPGEPLKPGPQAAPVPEPALSTPAAVAATREFRVEVKGPAAEVAFSNRGARVLSWRLREYPDPRGHDEEMVAAGGPGLLPLDIETGEAELDAQLRRALFEASSEVVVIPRDGSAEVRFRYAEGDVSAEKSVRFSRGGYLADVDVSVKRGGRELAQRVSWGPGLGNPTPEETSVQGYVPPQGVAYAAGRVEHFEPANLGSPVRPEAARWGGIASPYFAAVWLLPERTTLEFGRASLSPGEDGKERFGPVAAVLPGTGALKGLRLYVGPKDYEKLKQIVPGVEQVVPVGDWIGPIVVPLMGLLRWVHGHVGNYGWSIVMLTVLINLAMAPLRHYSISNGLKMARLAPEMRTIQERYRKLPMLDPGRQQMNEEIAALYARHGMNMGSQMLVGCLPLLLTMPFLIAFYRVLTVSIDLRGAPFMWMADLSQRDPLYLTPILMGLSMFLMQKMMPSTMDPAQQRIMMMMPIVLTVMLFAAPGGLNLYWLASNTCSIIQQGITLRLLRAPEARDKARRR